MSAVDFQYEVLDFEALREDFWPWALENGHCTFDQFLRNVQGIEPTWQQQELVDAIDAGETRISIRSGHGPGKSFIIANLILWYMCCHDDAIVPITGAVFETLKLTLWKEVKAGFKRLPEIIQDQFELTSEKLERKDAESYAVLRTSRQDKPEAMAGFHAPHLLLIFDEASGVPEEVYQSARGSMSTRGAIQVMTGNPTRLSGRFYRSHHGGRKQNHCLHWDGRESPNVDPKFAEEIGDEFGYESNEFRIRVTGDFPTSEENSLIDMQLIEAAINRDLGDEFGDELQYGIDVGRMGKDPTVLMKRRGNTVYKTITRRKTVLTVIEGLVRSELHKDGELDVKIDYVGIGAGLYDNLAEDLAAIYPVGNGETANNKLKFKDVRAESFWHLRTLFEAGDISIPDDPDLIAQLSIIEYTFTSRGQVVIVKKDDLKEKLQGASTDHADALALVFRECDYEVEIW